MHFKALTQNVYFLHILMYRAMKTPKSVTTLPECMVVIVRIHILAAIHCSKVINITIGYVLQNKIYN